MSVVVRSKSSWRSSEVDSVL